MFSVFFLYYPSTSVIYTLSLHDALPIYYDGENGAFDHGIDRAGILGLRIVHAREELRELDSRILFLDLLDGLRSEEHTSELQSRLHLVCRLLLEKKKN